MSAVMSRSDDFYSSTDNRSVDELDAAIGRLVRQMNADSYRMLVLVREFDDRFGWKKWTFKMLRRVARVALEHLAVGGTGEGANCARAACAAGDRSGICGRAVVVFEGARTDARRARMR